jgi:8-amino-7-oxononanoate synthase
MLDFSSARYLGLRHPRSCLPGWDDLTTGVPAALGEPRATLAVARRLAVAIGVERAVLEASTLHAFWGLFGVLAGDRPRIAVHVDRGAYPIGRWGALRAAAAGSPVRTFAHHDPDALRRSLRRDVGSRRRPVVLTDGFCPGCGRPAPLAGYSAALTERGGLLVVDDTQALGILGREPGREPPYGTGGGGALMYLGLAGRDGVIVVASLAKAFGVPLAVLGGAPEFIDRFESHSETRVHCGPPSAAAVVAAARAMAINEADGRRIRRRLASLVARFRSRLGGAGVESIGGPFPMQSVEVGSRQEAWGVQRRLGGLGVRAVPLDRGCRGRARVGFLITALHRPEHVDRAAGAILGAMFEGARASPTISWR